MSTTLTKGYKKPQSGDPGSSFFPDLEANIQRLNDHTHDGSNSQKLDATSSVGVVQNLLAAAWGAVWEAPSNTYRQVVTIPAPLIASGLTFDTLDFSLRSAAGGILYLRADKKSTGDFYIYSNDNTLDVNVVYTT